MSFSKLGLHPSLLRAIASRGFHAPTPIQDAAIGAAVEGRDLLGCAATGSGKTAAFLLPILHRLIEQPRRGTRALVLAPTRELASQIVEEADAFARGTAIRATAVVGGVAMRPQEKMLRAGVDIVVATPGRLLDHLNSGTARLDGVEMLVLDEADRMLDMGFLPDVRRILSRVPRDRQTLLFSATVPSEIARLASEMLREPLRIGAERKSAPAPSVAQHVYAVHSTRKSSLLVELLQQGVIAEALAFTRTKHRADRLAKFLVQNGIRADRIHGDRSQGQRTSALAAFKAGRIRVLVATDIAARGIDVDSLSHVVNFDIPNAAEDYIHRVGRTGRASATGDAFTFVSPEEERDFRAIERTLGKGAIARRQLEGFDYSPSVPPTRPPAHAVHERPDVPAGADRAWHGGQKAEQNRAKPAPQRHAVHNRPSRPGSSQRRRAARRA